MKTRKLYMYQKMKLSYVEVVNMKIMKNTLSRTVSNAAKPSSGEVSVLSIQLRSRETVLRRSVEQPAT